MQTRDGHSGHAIVLGIILTAPVCMGIQQVHPSDGSAASIAVQKPAIPSPPPTRITDRIANTKGKVFIVEYHHIRNGRGNMFRTVKQFRLDLETYYKFGFRPVLASEYLAGKMPLPS